MVNCNPETVSTDYDTADRLYFEPLTFEDVLEVVPRRGHVRPGGRRARRGRRDRAARRADPARAWRSGSRTPGCRSSAPRRSRSTWPRTAARSARCSPRPGCARRRTAPPPRSPRPRRSPTRSATRCWSGRPTCSAGAAWRSSTTSRRCATTSAGPPTSRRSTRCWSTGSSTTRSRSTSTRSATPTGEVYLGGVMEHIEEAGIHSGDSACALPPITLAASHLAEVRRYTEAIARGDRRARACSTSSTRSRTTRSTCWRPTRARRGPCRSSPRRPRCRWPRRPPGSCSARRSPSCAPRACCRPPATAATCRPTRRSRSRRRCCRSSGSAPPAGKGVDSLLGPEMKSTGEVMGIDTAFGHAFAKSQAAAYGSLPTSGKIFVSVANRDKRGMIFPVKRLADLGFDDRRHRRHRRGAAPARHRRARSCRSTTRAPGARTPWR